VKNKIQIARKSLLIIFVCIAVTSFFGCQTLKKKFTRKSKAEKENVEEVVYSPQEYPVQVISNEEMYRTYYTFWRGWHQELTEVLSEGENRKKQVECINEIITDLNKMKDLLTPDVQANLKEYIQQLTPIQEEIIAGRSNATNFYSMKMKMESLRSKITKDYTPNKVKKYIIIH
jgi:hypothetical protein